MKIGYPCINLTIGCKGNRTFRLKSFSNERLIETVDNNLNCLAEILKFNVDNNLLFFRITSDLVPFASHPICKFEWQKYFKNKFEEIGEIIKENNIRISMHPDQIIVLNSKKKDVIKRSIAEINYHTNVLNLMKLDKTAKIQIHVGGAYGNKEESLLRFAAKYKKLNDNIKARLVIENDQKIFSFDDCLFLHGIIKIPLVFDVLHYNILNKGESIKQVLENQSKTWNKDDGIPMLDYSTQKTGFRSGSHVENIDPIEFKRFLKESDSYDFDIMLEIKDKEKSAIKAVRILEQDRRFVKNG
jgi:UV DNA damage endonuclease